MTFKMMKTSKLIEHPENKGLFKDIAETSPAFWEEFKESIQTLGIIEPLIVDKGTNYIRSGNQRYKAASELGIEEVPVLMVEPETPDYEVKLMIASNVYRRTIDPFRMFEYIGRLRKGSASQDASNKDIAKETHKHQTFVSAADLYNKMEPEQQQELKEWFDKKADRTTGELIAQVKALEADSVKADERYDELVDLNRTAEERLSTLDEMLEERESKIATLTDVDFEGEIDDRDAKILKLEKQKTDLRSALKEAQERPDLHLFLKENIYMIKKVNGTLKEIVANKEFLNEAKLMELVKAVHATGKILKGVEHTTGERNAPKEIE